MMKQLFQFALSTAFKKLMGPQTVQHRMFPGPIHANKEKIKSLAVRYSVLAALSVCFLLLFIGSLIATILSVAHSYDNFGQFIGTALFWTSLALSVVSALGLAFSVGSLLKTEVNVNELIVREAVPEPSGWYQRYLEPLVDGISEGLTAPRVARPYRYKDADEESAA